MKSALFESLRLNMPAIADVLASRGRKGDTMLAHITPKEAKKLMDEGGAGTINPDTGLPEFYDFFATSPYGTEEYGGPTAPDYSAAQTFPRDYTPAESGGGYDPYAGADMYEAPSIETPSERGGMAGGIDFGQAPTETGVQLEGQYDPFAGQFGIEPSRAPSVADTLSTQLYSALEQARTPQDQDSILGKISEITGLDKEQLKKVGLAGIQAALGASSASKAAAQGREYGKQQRKLAAPYQQKGRQMVSAAERGELTPVNQQQLQALQARAAQGVEARGGVGAAQMQNQIEMFRQQLLQGQYDLGLKISGIGDQIALGAIKTGMEADRYVNNLTQTYYGNIARTLYGGNPNAPQSQTITITPGA